MRRPVKPVVEPLTLPFHLPIPLELRCSPRAKRLSLRIDLARRLVVLVTPRALAQRHALSFLIRHEDWLRARLAQMPPTQPFVDGGAVPLLGTVHTIRGDRSTLRGRVTCDAGTIVVPGAPEHLPRRLTEFLKTKAKHEIGSRARAKAEILGRAIKAITLRDTRSRWGSCNASGRLSFSWRLILAPEFVLDYVVAHEVAHLAELNHGPRFWKYCASLTATDPEKAKSWLRAHGAELHRYG